MRTSATSFSTGANCARRRKSHGTGFAISLNGRGVPSLDDALVNLELQPVHHDLRWLLQPDLVRLLADLAEHPRGPGSADRRLNRERAEFIEQSWNRCESFMRSAQIAYLSRIGFDKRRTTTPADPAGFGSAFRERIRAAMRIPVVEALFPTPWTAAARRVLAEPQPAAYRDGDVGTDFRMVRTRIAGGIH